MTATQQVKSRYPEHVQDEQNLKIIMNLGYVHIGLPKPVMHYIIRMRVPKTCTERLYNIIRIPGIVRNHHRYFSFSVKVPWEVEQVLVPLDEASQGKYDLEKNLTLSPSKLANEGNGT